MIQPSVVRPVVRTLVVVSALWVLSSASFAQAQESQLNGKLGIRGKETSLTGFGDGIGVDEVFNGSLAAKMGIRPGSFIGKIRVGYTNDDDANKKYVRRNPSFNDLASGFDKPDIRYVTIWWRKNGQWHSCKASQVGGSYTAEASSEVSAPVDD